MTEAPESICPSRRPCKTCPWRVDSEGGSAIPGFDIQKARELESTVGEGDAFRPIMACHRSRDGGDHVCIGYVVVEGYSNLAVRMAAITGRLPLGEIVDACEDLELHQSFDEMLDALEEAHARG